MRMLVSLTFPLALLVTIAAVWQPASADEAKKSKPEKSAPLRHVVMFRFKKDTPEAKIREIETAFAELPKKVDTITDYEWGINDSPEGLADGFTHCFLVTFDDAKGRDSYLPHAAHKEFVSLLKPHLDKAFVLDYVAKSN
jgi:hypothetical protein